GIRDFHVTGVQTCALPICAAGFAVLGAGMVLSGLTDRALRWPILTLGLAALLGTVVIYRALRQLVGARTPTAWQLAELAVLCLRSEERRVGKARRSRWLPE